MIPRDKRGTRLRGDHAQTTIQSAMTIHPDLIALEPRDCTRVEAAAT
jgi:hypothetical protein